jgi:branched-chain amino acid transport system substrate-binding protein
LVYAALQVLAEGVTKTGGVDQDKLAAYIHATRFTTVVGDIAFGKDGEWAEPRIFATQFQGIKGNDLAQFTKPGTEVIIYPEAYRSGELITPWTAADKK